MLTEEYISYISGIKRYSTRTCKIYKEILDGFMEFCGGTDVQAIGDLSETFTAAAVRKYEVFLLDEKKLSSRTVNLHMSVISGFCTFLMKSGRLKANPVRLLPKPKAEKRLPAFYREESMAEYFEETDYILQEDNLEVISHDKRTRRLIVSILFNTGIRRSELISLTKGSFDPGRKVLTVIGKGDKMREIPLTDGLCEEILLYLQSTATTGMCGDTPDTPLLRTAKGEKLYPVYVDRAIKSELGAVSGITGRKSPHVLRHTLATELLNNGTDLNSIKELLGHSSLAATQVYTHNSFEKLKQVYKQAHPRAKSEGNYGDKD